MRTGNKKKKHLKLSIITAGISLAVLAVFPLLSASHAGQTCEQWSGKVLSVQGNVEVSRAGEALWEPTATQELFCPGDRVRVGKNSRAAILLPNETLLRLAEGTSLAFIKEKQNENTWLEMLEGIIHFISRTPRSLNIKTPFVNASIDGTEFVLKVESDQTKIWVFEGQVSAVNAQGTLVLAGGETALAQKGKAPVRRLVVNPRDAVQWALYYPPVIDYRLENYTAGPDAPMLRKVLALYKRGDLPAAFALLDNIPESSRTAQYHDLSASLFLTIGRINEARSSINQALILDPNDGTAYALQSVIAVTKNNTQKALELAQKGVDLHPRSPVPHIALAYALQARFNIEKALQSMERAVNLGPQNALAWALLAELELSLGYIDRANASVRKAVELDPDQPRTQTVLGFANLIKIETDKAETAFNHAVDLDPADPLPRLGLGLAKIRQGNLDEGTEQIETAAILDPDNSLIRSYLGKAYYEQKRTELARTEFAIAKELDPNDPTPWFYDAILKQTENRPVEAFSDLQRSIELNDNRAIYRSRLLLDEDLAVRGAGSARIYDDLGFQKKAVMESTKSLGIDPTNYSAHRFLSESYTRYPQYRIAQVSELLQSQLFQPVNTTPVQPRMSTKGLNYLYTNSSGTSAFNEYDSLFENNGQRFTVSSVMGNHNTYGGEAVLSGLSGNFSYSLGQYYYETDGYREKSDVKHDLFDGYTQVALTHKVNLQFEYRHRDTDQGDLRMQLDPYFFPSEKRALEQDVGRAGLRISPSPNSDFIASFVYSYRRENYSENALTQVDTSDDRDGYETEVQYIYHESRFSFLMGGGIYRTDGDWVQETASPPIEIPGFPPIFIDPLIEEEKFEINGENIYAYLNVKAPGSFTWTVGLSYETFNDTLLDYRKKRINPKLGLQWDISTKWRFRTAFVRNTKRLLAVDQTIEPTQVAGFNQFFDDMNGAQSQLFGIATDIALTDQLYGGIEFTWRDISKNSENDEEVYRGYLYWLPHPNWSVNTEYRFEQDFYDFDLKTTTIPLTVRYFGHRGFFGQCGVTYVHQKQRKFTGRTLQDEFAVVDMSLGYRLPNRWGLICFEINNILDKEFLYQDASFKTSDQFGVVRPFVPGRTVQARVVLNF